ncbi:MAG: hypothetical protein K0Q93_3072 [Nocardioidaceae bacterium]|nr:hypothetical protein [Nocardioidaceae bacterium]
MSTKPAAPMPTPTIVCRLRSSRTMSAMMSSTSVGEVVGVSRPVLATTLPSRSTTPALTRVPPMSIPIARRSSSGTPSLFQIAPLPLATHDVIDCEAYRRRVV